MCGIVGLKPTLGRVGRGGLMMISFSKDVLGPITRTVIDAAMILEAISGKDPRDPESVYKPVPEYSALLGGGIKGKRFGVPKKHFLDLVHEDTQKVFDEALGQIRDMGGIVKDIELKHIDLAPNSFNVSLSECVLSSGTVSQGVRSGGHNRQISGSNGDRCEGLSREPERDGQRANPSPVTIMSKRSESTEMR